MLRDSARICDTRVKLRFDGIHTNLLRKVNEQAITKINDPPFRGRG